jgi:hypothetical protein
LYKNTCIFADEVKKPERKEIEFIADVVVKVTSDNPMKRKNLKVYILSL